MNRAPETNGSCGHILVVEDEPLLRALLADELRELGFSVAEASRADDALTYIEASVIDLVFTDVQMPGPIDGIALAHAVRARFPSVPVIVTSGDLGGRSLDGIAPFIPKPYRVEEALSLVVEALGRGRPA